MLDLVPRSVAVAAVREAKEAKAIAEAEAERERERRWEVEQRLNALSADKTWVDRSMKLREWTASHLVDFYSPSPLPDAYIRQTLKLREMFVPDTFVGMLHNVDGFIGGANAAGLFWVLTLAEN